MCLICSEWQLGKMTVKEVARAIGEYPEINPHLVEIGLLLDKTGHGEELDNELDLVIEESIKKLTKQYKKDNTK